ncbi:uncharacterized protein RSE6_08892 [Rhynchosporium secalis]|uniref:Uncharacterized protein n=1 Tax=Rhynchosporium secalis TaxID=38038 RepID=A0A1E1MGM1_RHYSE|nr:uncharacterized protein RSE6_08892 [Rhynchosporium secalis]
MRVPGTVQSRSVAHGVRQIRAKNLSHTKNAAINKTPRIREQMMKGYSQPLASMTAILCVRSAFALCIGLNIAARSCQDEAKSANVTHRGNSWGRPKISRTFTIQGFVTLPIIWLETLVVGASVYATSPMRASWKHRPRPRQSTTKYL